MNEGRGVEFDIGSQVRQTPEKGRGYIGQNVVNITIKMKTIVRK